MQEFFNQQIEAVSRNVKSLERHESLKVYSNEVTTAAQKGVDDLRNLGPQLNSFEAKKYLTEQTPKIAQSLRAIALKGLELIAKNPNKAIEKTELQPLEGLKTSLQSDLSQLKTEMGNFHSLEKAEKDAQSFGQEIDQIGNDNNLRLEEKIPKYEDLIKKTQEFKANLPGESTGTKQLRDRVTKAIDDHQQKIGAQLVELQLAKTIRDEITKEKEELSQKKPGISEKYSKYFAISEDGKVTFTPELKKLEKESPKEYAALTRELTERIYVISLQSIENQIKAAENGKENYKKAVEAYEQNPTPENKNAVKESEVILDQLSFGNPADRKRLGIQVSNIAESIIGNVEQFGPSYNKISAEIKALKDRFEKKEKTIDQQAADEIAKACDSSWNELVQPQVKEYNAFASESLQKLFDLVALQDLLTTPEQKQNKEQLRAAFALTSEKTFQAVINIKKITDLQKDKNIDSKLKTQFSARSKEAADIITKLENDRVRLKATESLKGNTDDIKSQLLKYIIWDKNDPKGYTLNLENLSLDQKKVVESQINLLFATDREAIKAEMNENAKNKKAEADTDNIEKQYGAQTHLFIEGLKQSQQGNYVEAITKMQDFVRAYETFSDEEKQKLAPVLKEAKNKILVLNLREIVVLEDILNDLAAVNAPGTSFEKSTAEWLKPGQEDSYKTEIQNVSTKLAELRKNIAAGKVTDVATEIQKIKTEIQQVNKKKEKGPIEDLEVLYTAINIIKNTDPDQDPTKRAQAIKTLQDFATKARENQNYNLAAKYLSLAFSKELDEAKKLTSQKGLTREAVTKEILASPNIVANINQLAEKYYQEFVKQYPNQTNKVSIEIFRQKILAAKSSELYQKALQRVMTEATQFKNNPSIQQFNNYFPADPAAWYKPWAYNAKEYDDFIEELKLQGLITIATLPAGMVAGAIGRGVTGLATRGASRLLLSQAERKALQYAQGMASAGIKTAQIETIFPGISRAMGREALAIRTGEFAGIGSEALSNLGLNDAIQYGLTGNNPRYLLDSQNKDYRTFGHALAESSIKTLITRKVGLSGQKEFGSDLAKGGAAAAKAAVKMEVFNALANTQIEAASLIVDNKGETIGDARFWVRSLVQNGINSAGSHIVRGSFGAKQEPAVAKSKTNEELLALAEKNAKAKTKDSEQEKTKAENEVPVTPEERERQQLFGKFKQQTDDISVASSNPKANQNILGRIYDWVRDLDITSLGIKPKHTVNKPMKYGHEEEVEVELSNVKQPLEEMSHAEKKTAPAPVPQEENTPVGKHPLDDPNIGISPEVKLMMANLGVKDVAELKKFITPDELKILEKSIDPENPERKSLIEAADVVLDKQGVLKAHIEALETQGLNPKELIKNLSNAELDLLINSHENLGSDATLLKRILTRDFDMVETPSGGTLLIYEGNKLGEGGAGRISDAMFVNIPFGKKLDSTAVLDHGQVTKVPINAKTAFAIDDEINTQKIMKGFQNTEGLLIAKLYGVRINRITGEREPILLLPKIEPVNDATPPSATNITGLTGYVYPESKIHFQNQAAVGLGNIHDAGYIHLDVKPGNMFAGKINGEIKGVMGDITLTDVKKVKDFAIGFQQIREKLGEAMYQRVLNAKNPDGKPTFDPETTTIDTATGNLVPMTPAYAKKFIGGLLATQKYVIEHPDEKPPLHITEMADKIAYAEGVRRSIMNDVKAGLIAQDHKAIKYIEGLVERSQITDPTNPQFITLKQLRQLYEAISNKLQADRMKQAG